jgi:hypothetical protein
VRSRPSLSLRSERGRPSCSQLGCVEPWPGARARKVARFSHRARCSLWRGDDRACGCSTSSRLWHLGAGRQPPRDRPSAQHCACPLHCIDGSFPSAAPSPKPSRSLTSTGASRSECRGWRRSALIVPLLLPALRGRVPGHRRRAGRPGQATCPTPAVSPRRQPSLSFCPQNGAIRGRPGRGYRDASLARSARPPRGFAHRQEAYGGDRQSLLR